jgi:hypothetical protein
MPLNKNTLVRWTHTQGTNPGIMKAVTQHEDIALPIDMGSKTHPAEGAGHLPSIRFSPLLLSDTM